jgi:hypothetical protein
MVRLTCLSLVILAMLVQGGQAFVEPPSMKSSTRGNGSSGGFISKTTLGLFDFLKQGKIQLVKTIAGNYDETAIQNRLDGLVKENPVLMLSFTT